MKRVFRTALTTIFFSLMVGYLYVAHGLMFPVRLRETQAVALFFEYILTGGLTIAVALVLVMLLSVSSWAAHQVMRVLPRVKA